MSTSVSLHEGIEQFALAIARRPVSDNTRKAFLGDVRIFERWIAGSTAARSGKAGPVTAIQTEQLKAFMQHLETSDSAHNPKSLERRLTSLKVFFDWLVRAGLNQVNPAEAIAYRPFMDALPEYLTAAQADAVVRAAAALASSDKQELRPQLAVMLVLETGIKKGECLALCLKHVRMGDENPAISIEYSQKHLQYKNRVLGLSNSMAALIRDYVAHYSTQDRLFDCTGRNLEYLFNRKVAVAAGLASLTFEQLRWTCAVREFASGEYSNDELQTRYGLSSAAWNEMVQKLQRISGSG